MKQKNSSVLTKQDLQEALGKLATKGELKELKNEISSLEKEVNTVKHDVKSVRNELSAIELRTDIKLDRLKLELDDNAKQYRDDILTKLDGVMGEFEKIREDREIAAYKAAEHEKRIKKLEQIRQAA